MPVRMLQVDRPWPDHLPEPSPGTLEDGPPPAAVSPERQRGDLKREALDRYARAMRECRTPNTRGGEIPIKLAAEYVPLAVAAEVLLARDVVMLRKCFVCGCFRLCDHREPELVDLYLVAR